MRALIVDSLPPEVGFGLEALGLQVTQDASIGSHNLPESVKDAEILVVGATRVTRRALEAGKDLRLVIHAGGGVESIDVTAASERGILVSHCGGAEAIARAELIIGMILTLDRSIHLGHGPDRPAALGLAGRSLGLYGFDATARRLREVAHGLGLRVHVYDEAMTATRASEAGVHRSASADALFRDSDIVSLHPHDGETGVVATAERLGLLGPHGTLINAARRGLIDLVAAKEALARGELRLGLDCYDDDDFGDDVPFAIDAFASLVTTPRLEGKTTQARDAIAQTLVGHVEQFLQTDVVPDCVNVRASNSESHALIVRFRPGASVLASVFSALDDAGVRPVHVHMDEFDQGSAGYARILLDRAPPPQAMAAVARHPDLLAVQQRAGVSATASTPPE